MAKLVGGSRKNGPRVSLGLPVRNGENYLQETLESILAQTFSDFELIISDNASGDQTEQICRRYAERDARIRFHRQTLDRGAAKNFNFVFQHSSGCYFKWIAYDDPIAPTYLEECVPVLDQELDVVLAYPRTILIDACGDVLEFHDDGFDLASARPHSRLRRSLRSSAFCHPVFGLIRSDVLARTGLIRSFPSSDKVLLAELAILGKCREVSRFLALRRLHPEMSTSKNQTDEQVAAWFDPKVRGRVFAPRWRRLWEIQKATFKSGVGLWDAAMCQLEVLRFYLAPERTRGVVKDLKQLSWALILRPLFRRSTSAVEREVLPKATKEFK